MRGREELETIRKWRFIIEDIEAEALDIRAKFGVHSPSLEANGGGSGKTRDQQLAEATTRLMELEQEKLNCLRMIRYVSNKIHKLHNAEEMRLLHLVYIQGMRQEEAADEMAYSRRQFFYIKRRAIANYERIK